MGTENAVAGQQAGAGKAKPKKAELSQALADVAAARELQQGGGWP